MPIQGDLMVEAYKKRQEKRKENLEKAKKMAKRGMESSSGESEGEKLLEKIEERYTWKEAMDEIPELEHFEPQDKYKERKYTLETWRDYLEDAREEVEEESEEELGLSEKARELERKLPGYAEVTEEDGRITITAKRGVETTEIPESILEVVGDFQEKHGYGLEALRSVSRGRDQYTAQEIILKPE